MPNAFADQSSVLPRLSSTDLLPRWPRIILRFASNRVTGGWPAFVAFWTAFLAFGSRLPTPLVSFFLVYVARTIEHFGAQYTSTPQRSGRQKTAASWPGIVRFAKCICRSIIRPPLHMRGPWSGALGSTRFASRTPSVFLSFFLYTTLSFPLYFPGKTAWKSSTFWL